MIQENLTQPQTIFPYCSRRDLALNIDNERTNLIELGEVYHEALADELTYYLGEFILKLPLMPFYYTEVTDSQEKRLTSPGFGRTDMLKHFTQPYLIKEKPADQDPAAIEVLLDRLPLQKARLNRDASEAKGFHELRQLVFGAEDDTMVGWVSPALTPDGYSITYFGEIKPIKTGKRLLKMVACVNHLDLAGHQNFLKTLGKELKPDLSGEQSEDFLLSPFVINLEEQQKLGIEHLSDLASVLADYNLRLSERALKCANTILNNIRDNVIAPRLPQLVRLISSRTEKYLLDKLLDRMELAAVKIFLPSLIDQPAVPLSEIDWDLQAAAFLAFSRKEMPKDGGSCPAVNRRNDLVTSINELMNALSDNEDEPQKCENCGQIRKESPDAGCCKGCRYK